MSAIRGKYTCLSCGAAFNTEITENQLHNQEHVKCSKCGKLMQFSKR